MSATAPGQLDIDAFKRATEARDAAALAAMYAPDATAVMVDHDRSPSQPQRLEGARRSARCSTTSARAT